LKGNIKKDKQIFKDKLAGTSFRENRSSKLYSGIRNVPKDAKAPMFYSFVSRNAGEFAKITNFPYKKENLKLISISSDFFFLFL
jgi:hypothetical protein